MALNFPDSPTLNQVYTDTTSGFSYEWDGVVWKSYTPSSSSKITILDDISGSFNGSTASFPLTASGTSITPANSQQLRVVLGGIVQEPLTDYYVAGSSIIFTTAPAALLDCSIVSLGPAIPVNAPNSGNIFARQEYNPTGVQTTFTFTSNYTPGYFEVYHNGAKLVDGTDYTATNGSTFSLTVPAQNGDVVEGITYLQTTLYTLGNYATDLTVVNNATVGGILTATSLVGPLTGNATGLSATPNITVGVVTATSFYGGSATITGNVSIAGTLTYEDVTNVDSVGLITARTGIKITAGGIDVSSGVSTFSGAVKIATGMEKVHRHSGNTVTLTYNSTSSSNVGYTTNPTGDITVNVVGIPTSSDYDDHAISFTVIVNNTGTARTCTAVNLNGVPETIRWAGGSLSAALSGVTTTTGHTIFSFTGINTVGSASTAANYQVFGIVSGGFF